MDIYVAMMAPTVPTDTINPPETARTDGPAASKDYQNRALASIYVFCILTVEAPRQECRSKRERPGSGKKHRHIPQVRRLDGDQDGVSRDGEERAHDDVHSASAVAVGQPCYEDGETARDGVWRDCEELWGGGRLQSPFGLVGEDFGGGFTYLCAVCGPPEGFQDCWLCFFCCVMLVFLRAAAAATGGGVTNQE